MIGIKLPFQIFCAVAVTVVLGGCLIGTDLWQDPVSGPYYFWAFEGTEQTAFIEENQQAGARMAFANPIIIVDAPVTAAGWDDRWVLVRQKAVNLYIFDMQAHRLYGPYDESKFAKQRGKLGVPKEIELNRDYTQG